MHDPAPHADDATPVGEVVDLDDWLDHHDEEAVDYDAQPFAPEDNERANWMLRRIGRLDAAQADDERLAATEKAKIDEWRAARTAVRQHRRDWFLTALDGFARVAAIRDGVRSISLPAGTLKLRKAAPRVEVVDLDKLAEWANTDDDTGQFIRVTTEAAKATLKAKANPVGWSANPDDPEVESSAVAYMGEVVPGVIVTRSRVDTFGYEVNR